VTLSKDSRAYDADVEVLMKPPALFPESFCLVDFSRGFFELPFHKEH